MSGRYRPADAFRSPRFAGLRTFMRLPHVEGTEGIDFAVMGLPFDTATSFRSGARFGPEAIRAMSLVEGKPAAYVCENFTCKAPVTDLKRLGELLKQ